MKKPLDGTLLLIGFILGIVASFIIFFVLDISWQRRFQLYNVRNQLYLGISRGETDKIVAKNLSFRVSVLFDDESRLTMYTPVGLVADSLTLEMKFQEDKLVAAKIVGEDNPQDVPTDAPPDLK
jgi:hypothetical protein